MTRFKAALKVILSLCAVTVTVCAVIATLWLYQSDLGEVKHAYPEQPEQPAEQSAEQVEQSAEQVEQSAEQVEQSAEQVEELEKAEEEKRNSRAARICESLKEGWVDDFWGDYRTVTNTRSLIMNTYRLEYIRQDCDWELDTIRKVTDAYKKSQK
jgi:hypothetical protein